MRTIAGTWAAERLGSIFFWLHERTGTEQLDHQRVIETGVVIVVNFF